MGTDVRGTAWRVTFFVVASACGLPLSGREQAGTSETDSARDDASAADASTRPPDDAPGPTDASAGVDAPDASSGPGCVTFGTGNGIAPFVYEGEPGGYTIGAESVTLDIASGKRAQLSHTFDATKIYSRSSVDFHLGVAWDGSWGPNLADYAELAQLFYGPTQSTSTSSKMQLTLAQNVQELNVWAPVEKTYGLGGMKVPPAETHLVVKTTWAPATGDVLVTMNPTAGVASWSLDAIATAATGPTDKLTVVIGGSGNGAVPTLRVFVFGVCVAFDP